MMNFARHLYEKPGREAEPPVGRVRAVNAIVSQMLVAGGFAATGFGLFLMEPNYGLGLLFWFAGIVFGAHFSDKIYDRIRNA